MSATNYDPNLHRHAIDTNAALLAAAARGTHVHADVAPATGQVESGMVVNWSHTADASPTNAYGQILLARPNDPWITSPLVRVIAGTVRSCWDRCQGAPRIKPHVRPDGRLAVATGSDDDMERAILLSEITERHETALRVHLNGVGGLATLVTGHVAAMAYKEAGPEPASRAMARELVAELLITRFSEEVHGALAGIELGDDDTESDQRG